MDGDEMFDAVSRVRIRRMMLVFLLGLALALTTGCKEDELEPTEAEGAFGLFANALQERDADEVWEYLDKDTKLLFTERYRALVRIDKIIQAYFDPAEHRDLRARTGVRTLSTENIDSAQALYHYTFNLVRPGSGDEEYAFKFDEDEEVGLDIDELQYTNEEETEANILTRGGQTFVMEKEEDGIWRTASLWGVFNEALEPIATSEANLRQYAEENLREERERRLNVIAYFAERVGTAPATPPEGASAARTPEVDAPDADDQTTSDAPQ